MTFCKISNLSRPIIHLHIDIWGIFWIPGRILACIRIPDSLQVGWLCTWLWRGDKKITAKLEVVGCKLRIGCLMEFLDALLCILSLLCGIAVESEVYTVKLLLVHRFMVGKCCSIILSACLVILQISKSRCICIATHIIVLLEVCCLWYDDCSMCGSCNFQLRSFCCCSYRSLSVDCCLVIFDCTITINHTNIGTEMKLVLYILAFVASRTHHCLDGMIVEQLVGNKFLYIRLVAAGVCHIEIELSSLVCLKTNHCYIILERSEYRALISYILYMIFHITRSCIHVKIAHIALCISSILGLCSFHVIEALTREANKHHSCCTVACTMWALRHPVAYSKILYRSIIFAEDSLLHLLQHA